MGRDRADDVAAFADRVVTMTDDELFSAMRELEQQSEALAQKKTDATDVFARIAIVKDLIEDRSPAKHSPRTSSGSGRMFDLSDDQRC